MPRFYQNAPPLSITVPDTFSPSLFEREMRGGLDDYRHLVTLSRLAAAKHDAAAQSLIQKRMDAFRLGQRDHDPLFPPSDWREFRLKMATAIERLQ